MIAKCFYEFWKIGLARAHNPEVESSSLSLTTISKQIKQNGFAKYRNRLSQNASLPSLLNKWG